MAIIWNESYETGHDGIDTQHRKLLAIVDELESAETQTHESPEAILDVLSHIMDFTVSHFSMEEDLMRQVEYPQAATDAMIEQHREFTSYARLRVLEFRRGEMPSVVPLHGFLSEWLTVHEVGLDQRLADFIRQRR